MDVNADIRIIRELILQHPDPDECAEQIIEALERDAERRHVPEDLEEMASIRLRFRLVD